jgi:hypothetical protein
MENSVEFVMAQRKRDDVMVQRTSVLSDFERESGNNNLGKEARHISTTVQDHTRNYICMDMEFES